MGIKNFETIDDLVEKLLIERKLKNENEVDIVKLLHEINYFKIFNGFETLLLEDASKKQFTYESIEDFTRLYDFDKKFSAAVFQIINKFEIHLKTVVSHYFCKYYCSTLNETMNYTNIDNFKDLKSISNYPLQNFQNWDIVNFQKDFIFFKPRKNSIRSNYLNKIIKKYPNYINPSFYSDPNYTCPMNVSVWINDKGMEDKSVAVPLWVSIQTIDFGGLKRFCHYINDNVMNEVLKEFKFPLNDRDKFLNMLDIINELRNNCAHFSLINRFRTSENIKILKSLVLQYNLSPKDKGGVKNMIMPSQLLLFDSLKILGQFENLRPLWKIFKSVIYQNNKHCKIKQYDLNKRLLSRMGNEYYSDWKLLLKDNNF